MPSRPPRHCGGCGETVPAGGRCPTCSPAWSSKRTTPGRSGPAGSGRTESSRTTSTRRWRKLRAAKLAADPMCGWPAGCGVLAVQVDHVKPVSEGGARYEWENLMSLCRPHHKEKTAAEALRGRQRARGR